MSLAGFVKYLKDVIINSSTPIENNIMNGAYTSHELTQKAVGNVQAFKKLLEHLDILHDDYVAKLNENPSQPTVPLMNSDGSLNSMHAIKEIAQNGTVENVISQESQN